MPKPRAQSGDATRHNVFIGVGFLLLFPDILNCENFRKLCPGAIDAALDGSDCAIADLSRLLVRKARGTDQNEGLALVRGLSGSQLRQAIIYDSMLTKDQPPERYTPNDGRQRSVTFKGNVGIPFEGLRADSMSKGQRKLLLDLVSVYTSHLRPGHNREWQEQVRRHLDETWFAWIGGCGDNDTFYYKVHSPVLLVEFDMHKGVFLSNDEPEKFHIHAVVRTPNGNDYGKDLLRQHLARHHHPPRA